MKRSLVLGASGLIGSHMVRRLKAEGRSVRALARHQPKYWESEADEFCTIDLRYIKPTDPFFEGVDEVYQFACEVGGLGYIANHANDAECLRNSTLMDLNVLEACRINSIPRVFFASSACVYGSQQRFFKESAAYPANCSNEFAWQKLFAERLYQAYAANYNLDIRIGRLFNTYGLGMVWTGGREKSVAALCRKVAQAKHGEQIEVWGSGEQMRSYTHVDDAVEGIWRLMQAEVQAPLNIGPQHEVSIRDLIRAICKVANKNVFLVFGDGPVGVSRICSDNTQSRLVLGWEPQIDIETGLEQVYPWVANQVLTSS